MRAEWKLKILVCFLVIVSLLAEAEARTVNVAVPTLSMVVIAFTAAKEKGYYQEEGLDVNLVVMRDTLGISALIGGSGFCLDERRRIYRDPRRHTAAIRVLELFSPHVLALRQAGVSRHQNAQRKKDWRDGSRQRSG
jgi:hypothetical protein